MSKSGLYLSAPFVLTCALANLDGASERSGVFREHLSLVISVNEEIDLQSRVYTDPTRTRFVLVSSRIPSRLVLDLKVLKITALTASQIVSTPTPNEVQLVEPLRVEGKRSNCKIQGDTVRCLIDNVEIRVHTRPQLIGDVKLSDLYAYSEHYKKAQSSYTPDPEALKVLKGITREFEIQVFFGTWCTTCKSVLPNFLKAITTAHNPRLMLRLIGMNKDLTQPSQVSANMRLQVVPTFVVINRGKEIGRFSAKETRPEIALARILRTLP